MDHLEHLLYSSRLEILSHSTEAVQNLKIPKIQTESSSFIVFVTPFAGVSGILLALRPR